MMKDSIKDRIQNRPQSSDVEFYYERCTLGRLLIEHDRTDDAIDELMSTTDQKFGGEAKYLMAVAYAKKGEAMDSVRWLKQAVTELPRWAAVARNNEALKGIMEINEYLASLQRRVGETNHG